MEAEVKTTRTVKMGVENVNLLKHGLTYCRECGNNVFINWDRAKVRGLRTECGHDHSVVLTEEGKELHTNLARKLRLNKTAMKMIASTIDWSGIDIVEYYDEYGSFREVAEELGVSERSVRRRYYEVIGDRETPQALNSF